MSDRNRGVCEKFIVTRTDGKSDPGEKHDGCRYFVLDLDHDPHALPALEAYAESCRDTHPVLWSDLKTAIGRAQITGRPLAATFDEAMHGIPLTEDKGDE